MTGVRLILKDHQWARMEPHLPGKSGDPGRTGADRQTFFEAKDLRRELVEAAVGVFGAAEILGLAVATLKSPRVLKITIPIKTIDPETGELTTRDVERFATRENYSADRRVGTWVENANVP